MKTRKMVVLSLMVSLALAISVLELSIPIPIPIPGARLGFSNIIILTVICMYDFKSSITVSILKSVLLMLVTGSVSSFLYSFVGSLLSTFTMYLSVKFLQKYLTLVGVSEIGSFFHNFGQILVASFVMDNISIFYYLPMLIIIGIFTGFFVGISTNFLTQHFHKIIRGTI
ncbi:MAG: Gx transporter family protein [Peptoniphilaceae bacterium]|nr:Gx transporter family protein [Peptoniphilaceae bacterium]MDD7383325.1 Gx transporter family protein [Peptoniphilaceae bacterium]MDY3738304.1 Gx transporter family protein [Peptoniphilaceae bacterium]